MRHVNIRSLRFKEYVCHRMAKVIGSGALEDCMKRAALICGIAFPILVISFATAGCGSEAPQGAVQTITLDQIWAFEMPGTHDIRELEPDKFGESTRNLPSNERFKLLDESLTFQIRAALKRDNSAKAGMVRDGFAVIGTGREALDGAYNVFVKDQKPSSSFPLDSNVTLVFYSRLAGQYVHIDEVKKETNTIEIRYQFVPHLTTNSTWHLALIPVGKLPIGKYQVKITQSSGGKDKTGHLVGGLPTSEAQRIVCGSFSFSVVDRKDND
jgi:hypothetical protein